MRGVTKAYMGIVSTAGIALALWYAWHFFAAQSGNWSGTSISVFLLLLLLSWGCTCLPIYIRDDCTVDLSFISLLASALLLGPEGAITITLITGFFVIYPSSDGKTMEHILNTPLHKTLFNQGNLLLSYSAGAAGFYAVGGIPGDISLPQVLPPAFLFIISVVLTNVLIILIYFRLTQHIPLYTTFLHMFIGLLPSIGLSAPIGYFLAMLLQMRSGVWLTLLFMLPLLLARYSFKLYLDTRKHQEQVIRTLAAALEAKDPYTEGHSQRVEYYAGLIAEQMGLSEARRAHLSVAALFHDIGKIGIPDAILLKPGALTPEERTVIQTHPATGVHILERLDGYQSIIPLVLHHHEFFDGRGYPEGTSGDQLSLETYILGAADAYDAITSDRPYRKGRSPQQAAAILRAEAGRQFHPEVARVTAELAESGQLERPAGLQTAAQEARELC